MRQLKEKTIGERKVILKELTVPEADRVFAIIEKGYTPRTMDWLFGDKLPAFVMDMIMDVSLDELLKDDLAPSELEPLYDAALEVNSFLSKSLAAMNMMGQAMMAGLPELPSTSLTEDTTESGNTDSASS